METSQLTCFVFSLNAVQKATSDIKWLMEDYTYSFLSRLSSSFATTKQATPPAITCSKLTIETLEQDVKYVRS